MLTTVVDEHFGRVGMNYEYHVEAKDVGGLKVIRIRVDGMRCDVTKKTSSHVIEGSEIAW